MKIKINQSLHGYENGHQLLACSMELNTLLKKILLFQTDLSGSNVSKGFETYITGYPIEESNLYAFSKTWYADEMKRPGCVWTHTFFIDFSDLSVIEEFQIFVELFKRPVTGEYDLYNEEIEIDAKSILEHEPLNDITVRKLLFNSLYKTPEKTIFLPSVTPQIFEKTIISLWSNQWPRLRRNFFFCTGALSFKTLNGREFDLQIIPKNIISIVEKQSNNPLVLDLDENVSCPWIDILSKYQKTEIRKFLWTFGAETDGRRGNYIPLIEIFDKIHHGDKTDLRAIAEIIARYFPLKQDAKFLKYSLFAKNSTLLKNMSEKEVVIFLIKHNVELNFIEEEEVKIRTIELLKLEKLNFGDLIAASSKGYNDLILEGLWDFIDAKNIIEFIDQYPELIDDIAERKYEIFFDNHFWELPMTVQKTILGAIYNAQVDLNISKIVEAVLNSKSEIIYDFGKLYPTATTHGSLDWLNAELDRQFTKNWIKTLFNNHDANTFKWYNANIKNLSDSALTLLIENIAVVDMHRINFSHKTWVNLYHRNNTPIAYGFKLSAFGFRDKISGSEWLVAETLSSIFHSLKSTNKELSEFNLPSESNLDNEIYTPFQYFSQMIWGSPKSQKRVTGIGETFLQVVLYNFIKNRWSRQAFLYSLKEDDLFTLMLHLAFQSNKGKYFIWDIVDDLKKDKIQPHGNQIKILKEALKSK